MSNLALIINYVNTLRLTIHASRFLNAERRTQQYHVIAGEAPQTLQWGFRSTAICWNVIFVPEK